MAACVSRSADLEKEKTPKQGADGPTIMDRLFPSIQTLTVGPGFSPDQLCTGMVQQVAGLSLSGITAGRDLHPAPENMH